MRKYGFENFVFDIIEDNVTMGSTVGKIFRYLDNNKNIILPKERKITRFQKIKDNVLDQYKQYI